MSRFAQKRDLREIQIFYVYEDKNQFYEKTVKFIEYDSQ